MTTRVRTLVVGAGQAGLALSRHLTDAGHDHLLLERGLVAQRWRSERWDSFRLLTPNWHTRLPGYSYAGPDPDGFMDRRQVVDFFAGYAASFDPPLRTGVSVTGVHPTVDGWAVESDNGRFEAGNVVVATGHYDRPRVPELARRLPRGVTQLHTWRYRNPDRLPPGGVLVVGAGPSGQQIAMELARAGRRVHLAVGRHRPLPRRYRGRDVYWWMQQTGMLARTVDSLPDPHRAQYAPSVVLAGEAQDLHLRRLADLGVVAHGRLASVDGDRIGFAADLPLRLREADANHRRLRASVEEFLRHTAEPTRAANTDTGVDAAVDQPLPSWALDAPAGLSLAAAGISTVVWATGHRHDYSWIHAPVFHADGQPIHRRGVTPAAGLAFLGLRWMHRRDSNFIGGVGADAEFLAEQLVGRPALRAVG